ncbi:MAG: hypothetical protein RL260_3826 [Pseudomonadota bacterium]|jgi:hypothetical protein
MISADLFKGAGSALGGVASKRIADKLYGSGGVKNVQLIHTRDDAKFLDPSDPGYMDNPQYLLGGYSLAQTAAAMDYMLDARLSRKNLYFVEMEDPNPPALDYGIGPKQRAMTRLKSNLFSIFAASGGLKGIAAGLKSQALGMASGALSSLGFNTSAISGVLMSQGVNVPHVFNLFATEISYSEVISGEPVKIGGTTSDKVSGREPVEISITTLDDEAGTIKRWFTGKQHQAVHPSGTVGLPAQYCIRLTTYHATPNDDIKAFGVHLMMRPGTIQSDLSRGEGDCEQVKMTFVQADQFVI